MRWQPGSTYAYCKPGMKTWQTAKCIQDEHTGVIRVQIGKSRIKVNHPRWFAPYKWRGPVSKGQDPGEAPIFHPPGVPDTQDVP